MKALIFQNKVIQVEQNEFEVSPTMIWVDCPDNCVPGWTYIDGVLAAPAQSEPNQQEIINSYTESIQEFIDGVAMEKSYKSSLNCASYANCTVPQWKSEADSFIAWRDAVWLYSIGELAKFQTNERPLIPVQQFIQELPAIQWP